MSLVNNNLENVKFVNYTGKYPNLCDGILTLEIDGVNYRFGCNRKEYYKFWHSGGSCGFLRDGNPYVNKEEWIIDVSKIPEEFRKYGEEINKIFNDNVPLGCC